MAIVAEKWSKENLLLTYLLSLNYFNIIVWGEILATAESSFVAVDQD